MDQVLASECEKNAILEGLEAIEKGKISKAFNSVEGAIEFLNSLEV